MCSFFASGFRDIVCDIDAMDADVITFEVSRSGLKTRGETETTASLKNLVAAAKQLRNEA